VTAQLASENDRFAFVDGMLGQLLAIVGERLPPKLTEVRREALFYVLLERAARACRARGERLVVLVDGLDEDRGEPSVAAMLPIHPLAGTRLVVASRPDLPIPGDVLAYHPLRDPAIIRALAPWVGAQAARQETERELDRFRQADQDLLGLVVAAGGGLSAADLAELTTWPLQRVSDRLGAAGRSITARAGQLRATDPEVHLAGHHTLHLAALEWLGPSRLAGYRHRLHGWAQGYQNRHWPPDTPEYLLRGYFRLLHTLGETERMISLATDRTRHDRLAAVTGSDAAALTEITTTTHLGTLADLGAAELARHHIHLVARNFTFGTATPGTGAVRGYPDRLLAMISDTRDPARRVTAVAGALSLHLTTHRNHAATDPHRGDPVAGSDSDDSGWIAVVLDDTLSTAHTITDPDQRAWALAAMARVLALAGDLDRALTVARAITHPDARARAMVNVARTGGQTVGHGAAILDEALTVVRAVDDPGYQTHLLVQLVDAALEAKNPDRGAAALDDALTTARAVSDPIDQARALRTVARAAASAGQVDRALTIAGGIADPDTRALATAEVAGAAAAAGQVDQAITIAQAITHPDHQASALVNVANAVREAGNPELAETILRPLRTANRIFDGVIQLAVRSPDTPTPDEHSKH
jgi:hypothetical protein